MEGPLLKEGGAMPGKAPAPTRPPTTRMLKSWWKLEACKTTNHYTPPPLRLGKALVICLGISIVKVPLSEGVESIAITVVLSMSSTSHIHPWAYTHNDSEGSFKLQYWQNQQQSGHCSAVLTSSTSTNIYLSIFIWVDICLFIALVMDVKEL